MLTDTAGDRRQPRSRVAAALTRSADCDGNPYETRVTRLFTTLALRLALPVMAWSSTNGLHRIDYESAPQRHTSEPRQALGQVKATSRPTIYLLLDFHPYLDDPHNVRLLKEIVLDYPRLGHTLVLVSHQIEIPPELRSYSARFSLSLPDAARLEEIIREEAGRWSTANHGKKVQTDRAILDRLVSQLRGLTAADARRIIRSIIYDDDAINSQDLNRAARERYSLLDPQRPSG